MPQIVVWLSRARWLRYVPFANVENLFCGKCWMQNEVGINIERLDLKVVSERALRLTEYLTNQCWRPQ